MGDDIMIKKILSFILVLSLIIAACSTLTFAEDDQYEAENPLRVFVDGEELSTENPIISDGTQVMVSLSDLTNLMGYELLTRTHYGLHEALVYRAKEAIFLRENSLYGYSFNYVIVKKVMKTSNVKQYTYAAKPKIIDGILYVPLKTVCEKLKAEFDWNTVDNIIYVTTAEYRAYLNSLNAAG
jgi:hypothetical protein